MNVAQKLKMKDLERLTGVGREAIRYYIHEGLLPEPERPARNVAWYDPAFVDRIRLIKELQEKRFLPLQVIKAMLGAGEEPTRDEVQALMELDGKIFPAMEGATPGQPERIGSVASRVGVPVRDIRELVAAGVVEIETHDGSQWLDADSIRIVEHWAKMREHGFTEARGFTPDLVRLHVDFVDWLVREELRLFSARIAGTVPADEAARMAEAGIEHINHILGLMRRRTLLRYVAQGNLPETQAAARPAARPKAS